MPRSQGAATMAAAIDTVYQSDRVTVHLRANRRYRWDTAGGAEIPDDGIVDQTAVDQYIAGRRVRITPREVVCIVAELNARRLTDRDIAAQFGRTDSGAGDWIKGIRVAHGIPGAEPAYDDEYSWQILNDNTHRARASKRRLDAAGAA